MKRVELFSAVVGLALGASVFAAPPAPPVTEKKPVTDTIHGKTFVDDYRWLEGDNSDPANMGKVTPEVSAWTDVQNAYTRSVLGSSTTRRSLLR